MKKLFILASFLTLCGCVNKYPEQPILAISNEKNTEIWLDEEYQGSDQTNLLILNSKAKDAYVYGKKKGCPVKKIKIEYNFDITVFWIINPYQLLRLVTLDVWKVNQNKYFYNVTPECSK